MILVTKQFKEKREICFSHDISFCSKRHRKLSHHMSDACHASREIV